MVEARGINAGSTSESDDQRCVRNDGKKWRCRGMKFQGYNYCEKHFKQNELKKNKGKLKLHRFPKDKQDKGVLSKDPKRKGVDSILRLSPEEEDEEEEEEEVPLIRKKRKVVVCNDEDNVLARRGILSSSEEEEVEEEEVQVQPTTIMKKYHTEVFATKRREECSISELILSLRAAFGQTDFEKVASIVKGREEKLKMEREEAEKKASCFKQELETCEDNCNKLLNEVEERREKEVNAVEVKVKELERNRVVIEDRVKELERNRVVVEDKAKELERNRVVVEEDLRKYMKMCIELKTKNRELESEKSRAENEVGIWKKKFQDLQTKGVSAVVSRTEEGKKNMSRQMRIEGGSGDALVRGCLSNIKIKEAALDFNAKVNASPSVDSSCHFSAKEGGIGQHAESGVKDGSVAGEKKACQLEGSSYKTPISPKIEHRSITREQMASQPDGSSYKMICSPTVDIKPFEGTTKMNSSQETKAKSIHLKECSAEKKNGGEKESSSDQNLASTTERKWTCEEGSSDSKSCEICTVMAQSENSKGSLTSPQQKSISPQKITEKRNGAVSSSENLVIHENAETDNGKEGKGSRSDCGAGVASLSPNSKSEGVEDGISKFLHELRRLKASKPDWKGSPLVVE